MISFIQLKNDIVPIQQHDIIDHQAIHCIKQEHRCVCLIVVLVSHSEKYVVIFLRFSRSFLRLRLLASVDKQFCTKENCSNETTMTHGRYIPSTFVTEEISEEQVERACDTLFMCIVTTLNKGLRNGGGIGDVLRQPSSQVSVDRRKRGRN